jgi:hypothetical protein
MEIKLVSYQEIFNLGNYCSQRIGVEVAVNPGENAMEALETARKLVHEYHRETEPEEMRGTHVRDLSQNSQEREDQIKNEYLEVEAKLNEFEYQEDAVAYLDTTTFKHYIPAKMIANSKPIKNK